MNWEFLTAFFGMVGGTVIALLAHRRNVRVDVTTATSSIADSTRADIAQALEIFKANIDNLQEDNQGFRTDNHNFKVALKECADNLSALLLENAELKRQNAELTREVERMHRMYEPIT